MDEQIVINTKELDTGDLKNYLKIANDQVSKIDLKIFHVNIRSVRKNFDELKLLLSSYLEFIDVIILSEIWINESELIYYQFPNFEIYYKIREYNRSGGIMVFVNKKLTIRQNLINFETAEVVSLYIEELNLEILSIYRSHSYSISQFNNELTYCLENDKKSNLIICGDINIDLLSNNSDAMEYKTIMANNGLMSYINGITRQQLNNCSCIDHYYVRNSKTYVYTDSAILNYNLTDHNPIILKIQLNKNKYNIKANKRTLKRQINWNLFEYYIENYGNPQINNQTTVDDILDYVYEILYYAHMKSLFFIETDTNSKPHNEWMTKDLILKINKKEKLYKIYKNDPFNLNAEKEYKTCVVNIKKEIKNVKKLYYSNLLNQNRTDNKMQWNIINSLIGKKKKENTNILELSQIELNEMNTFFTEIAYNINIENPNYHKENWLNDFIAPSLNSFVYYEVTQNEVQNVINTLKDNTSPGSDNILKNHVVILMKYKPYLLINLINKSVLSGKFPDYLKVTKIKPIYKSGPKNDYSNYRPIAVLSIFSKLIEKIIKLKMEDYIAKFQILSKNQYGFRKNLSTQSALIELNRSILHSVNMGEHVIAIFLDIKKAFDTVDHIILLEKMFNYGFRDLIYKWMTNYLNNRVQYIKNGASLTDFKKINTGVPQGSVLGALLFIIYINDLCRINIKGKILSYADDTVIFYSSNNLSQLNKKIEDDLKIVKQWFNYNKLVLNINKTNIMNFTLTCSSPITIKFHKTNCSQTSCQCQIIHQVTHIKYLGVIWQSNLKWNLHINNIINRLRMVLYHFYHLRKNVDNQTLKMLYFSWVYPIILYGILCFGGTYYSTIQPLESIINKLTKLTNLTQNCTNSLNNIQTVRKIFIFSILKTLYLNPDLFQLNIPIRQLRTNTPYFIPHPKKTIFMKSLWYLGPKIYNIFSSSLNLNDKYTQYKKSIYEKLQNMDAEELF